MVVSTFFRIFAEMKRNGSIYCLLCLCALWLMASCAGDGAQMRQQLEALEQQNRSGEQMLNDSLAESLVDYFNKHGDANERMRAKYILGRTYYCLGELPRALETYYEAADCADTTASDCNFKVLSRVYGQSSTIFERQFQSLSRIEMLKKAMHCAIKANDTLATIDYYALMVEPYRQLGLTDSVIEIVDRVSSLYEKIQRKDQASKVMGTAILSLLKSDSIKKAKHYIDNYEKNSGLFDECGNIQSGREIYYYIKGEYFLAVHQLDSAEFLFRKELRDGKDLNNQIAGCKGLQKVFERKAISDSIAKYANLGYILNDSAYSLSEMQNIQRFQASYNYNHQKILAEQSARKAEQSSMWLIIVVVLFVVLTLLAYISFQKYKADKERDLSEYHLNQLRLEEAQSELLELREKNMDAVVLMSKKTEEIKALQAKIEDYHKRQSSYDAAVLEDRIENSVIVNELNSLLESNPVQSATQAQMRELKKFINEQIPCFYKSLNASRVLRPIEYEVCLLTRCHFNPASISKLLDRDDGYIANLRKGILLKVYGIKGSPKDLDERIMKIV